jgi:hypothetical protein
MERLPKDNADVFDRMMLVDSEITVAFDCQIESAVLRKQRQHMVEKADSRP